MNSLSELNNISKELITFIDQRPAGIRLDRDQINYYNTFTADLTVSILPPVNILEVINPSIAYVRYSLEIKSDQLPKLTEATITWNGIPSNIVISNALTKYTLTGISSNYDWEAVKKYKLNLLSNYNLPNWYIEGTITYFDDALHRDVSYSWVDFDPRYYYAAVIKPVFSLEVTITSVNLFSSTLVDNFTMYANGQRINPSNAVAMLLSNASVEANAGKLLPDEILIYSSFTTIIEQNIIPAVKVNMQSAFTQIAEGLVYVIRSHMVATSTLNLIKSNHQYSMHANLTSLSSMNVLSAIRYIYKMQAGLQSSFTINATVNQSLETLSLDLKPSFSMNVTAISDHVENLDQTILVGNWPGGTTTVTYNNMLNIFPLDKLPYMDFGTAALSATVSGSNYFCSAPGQSLTYNFSHTLNASTGYTSTTRYWPVNSGYLSVIKTLTITVVKNGITTYHTMTYEPYYSRLLSSTTISASVGVRRKASGALTSGFTSSITASRTHLYNVNITRDCVNVSSTAAYATMTQLFSTSIPYMEFANPSATTSYIMKIQCSTNVFRAYDGASMTTNVSVEMNPNNPSYYASAITDIRARYSVGMSSISVYLNNVLYSQFTII